MATKVSRRGRRGARRPAKGSTSGRPLFRNLILSQAEAGELLQIPARKLRDLPAPREQNSRGYRLQPLVAWWGEYCRTSRSGPSEALERIRTAKADQAERRNAIELGKLIDMECVVHSLRWILGTMMSAFQSVEQDLPSASSELLRSAMEKAREQFKSAFPHSNGWTAESGADAVPPSPVLEVER